MAEHDTLAQRLGVILTKLNHGQRLVISELAHEFNVSPRTIQRDLNVRLAYLPLEREGQTYWLDPSYFGRASTPAILRLCEQVGAKALFPDDHDALLKQWLNPNGSPVFVLSGFQLDEDDSHHQWLKPLAKAISQQLKARLTWVGEQTEQEVEPYRLVNKRGRWYLAGVSTEAPFIEPLSRISLIRLTEAAATIAEPQQQILQRLIEQEAIPSHEVVIKAASPIAHEFKLRNILPEQALIRELEDGSILLASRVFDGAQLLPVIKTYLPHLEVISPAGIQALVKRDLKTLLSRM
ncbi:MAG: helix-turn-helix transcriptional regulator [Aeromonas salmonicida]|uniref:helix-turn-helix transcriptional regulator n=1 Tax=Aeromonas salmonicida TaxID=645 RepID=UPI00259D6D68|nr:WYL domain-containing protein [Aeromonas salmonicida]MDM5070073.1 WYL domain-containing protein [Aeromonas salmonicida]MDM5150209.1 WYL domain-containing protein [Aeromonas salmonicida]